MLLKKAFRPGWLSRVSPAGWLPVLSFCSIVYSPQVAESLLSSNWRACWIDCGSGGDIGPYPAGQMGLEAGMACWPTMRLAGFAALQNFNNLGSAPEALQNCHRALGAPKIPGQQLDDRSVSFTFDWTFFHFDYEAVAFLYDFLSFGAGLYLDANVHRALLYPCRPGFAADYYPS